MKTVTTGWKIAREVLARVRLFIDCGDYQPAFQAAPFSSIPQTKRPSQRLAEKFRSAPAACVTKPHSLASSPRCLSTTISPCFFAVRPHCPFCDAFALRRLYLPSFLRRPRKNRRLLLRGESSSCHEPSCRETEQLW